MINSLIKGKEKHGDQILEGIPLELALVGSTKIILTGENKVYRSSLCCPNRWTNTDTENSESASRGKDDSCWHSCPSIWMDWGQGSGVPGSLSARRTKLWPQTWKKKKGSPTVLLLTTQVPWQIDCSIKWFCGFVFVFKIYKEEENAPFNNFSDFSFVPFVTFRVIHSKTLILFHVSIMRAKSSCGHYFIWSLKNLSKLYNRYTLFKWENWDTKWTNLHLGI